MASEIVGPSRVAIDSKSFFDTIVFLFFIFLGGWYEGSPTSKGTDGGEFVAEGCVGIEWDILICVCGFPVNIKGERAVSAAMDGNVQQGYFAFRLLLFRPFEEGGSFHRNIASLNSISHFLTLYDNLHLIHHEI